jgi:hypothetical protein
MIDKFFTVNTLNRLLGPTEMFMWHGEDTVDKDVFKSKFAKVIGTDQFGTAITSSKEKDWGFTWEQYVTTYNQVADEWNNTAYQRSRQPEYPPLADLADALYWQTQGDDRKMTAYLAAVNAVKTKYPKGGA